MVHNLIHIHSTGNECIIRLSFISCAKWEGLQLLVFLVGDSDPIPVEGDDAQRLWILLYAASLSVPKTSVIHQARS